MFNKKSKSLLEEELHYFVIALNKKSNGNFVLINFNNFYAKLNFKRQFTKSCTLDCSGYEVELHYRDGSSTYDGECECSSFFWVEVVFIVVYLLKLYPTQVVKQKTLEKVWFNKKPKLAILRSLITFLILGFKMRKEPN